MPFNDSQQKIINHINGPLLCIAGPGSGKTTSIIYRVINLIKNGISPDKILVITFTKASADEMKTRYLKNPESISGPTFCTIHSLCYKVANQYNSAKYNFKNLISENEQKIFIIKQIKSFRIEFSDFNAVFMSAMNAFSRHINTGLRFNEMNTEYFMPEQLSAMYAAYTDYKNIKNKYDFDDLLIDVLNLFKGNKNILCFWQQRFKYYIIDEFQDTNKIQAEIFYLLSEPDNNICVVGDDDQSIYGFRGADPNVMMDFEKRFKGCNKIILNINYRSCSNIVNASLKLINTNKYRFVKPLVANNVNDGTIMLIKNRNPVSEVENITKKIKELKKSGEQFNEISVLYRTNIQSQGLITSFIKNDIPFYTEDSVVNIFEHWIFRDIKNFKKVADDKCNIKEFLSVVNRPNKYIPGKIMPKDYNKKEIIAAGDFISDSWQRTSYKKKITEWYRKLDALKECSPKEFIEGILYSLDYLMYVQDYAQKTNTDFYQLQDVIQELIMTAEHFTSFEEYYSFAEAEIKITKEKVANMKKESSVFISTMHKAKGLEWKNVFIIDCNENIVPYFKANSDEEQEEEKRLFYVAITRAKENLFIHYVEERNNKAMYPSSFLVDAQIIKSKRSVSSSKETMFSGNNKQTGLSGSGIVVHNKFGQGKVISSDNMFFTVLFSSGETKKFVRATFDLHFKRK